MLARWVIQCGEHFSLRLNLMRDSLLDNPCTQRQVVRPRRRSRRNRRSLHSRDNLPTGVWVMAGWSMLNFKIDTEKEHSQELQRRRRLKCDFRKNQKAFMLLIFLQ
jgi:hypothetical protein